MLIVPVETIVLAEKIAQGHPVHVDVPVGSKVIFQRNSKAKGETE